MPGIYDDFYDGAGKPSKALVGSRSDVPEWANALIAFQFDVLNPANDFVIDGVSQVEV